MKASFLDRWSLHKWITAHILSYKICCLCNSGCRTLQATQVLWCLGCMAQTPLGTVRHGTLARPKKLPRWMFYGTTVRSSKLWWRPSTEWASRLAGLTLRVLSPWTRSGSPKTNPWLDFGVSWVLTRPNWLDLEDWLISVKPKMILR